MNVLKPTLLSLAVIVIILLFSMRTSDSDSSSVDYLNQKLDEKEMGIFDLSNDYRKKQSLDELVWDECLYIEAIKKSRELFNKNYFGHKNPETGENESWSKIEKNCGFYSFAGENLTKGNYSANDFVEALIESPSHRKNILGENYDVMAVGCYGDICTQLFASFNLLKSYENKIINH